MAIGSSGFGSNVSLGWGAALAGAARKRRPRMSAMIARTHAELSSRLGSRCRRRVVAFELRIRISAKAYLATAGWGSIVNFSSTAWMYGGADFVAYATAKAAVIGLTNALARQFGPDDIRVNALAPGAVQTERQLRLWYTKEQANDFINRQLPPLAARRRSSPHGALPCRRRQPHDYQATHRRRCRPPLTGAA